MLYRIRPLQLNDTDSLFLFEQENRAWFEANIGARESGFYSLGGVKEHVNTALSDVKQNKSIALVIVTEVGDICGRVNLHNVNVLSSFAYLGYRIGFKHIGQGLATRGVNEIIEIAHQTLGIKYFAAYSSVENHASQRILQKTGFERRRIVEHFVEVHGDWLDCIEYRYSL